MARLQEDAEQAVREEGVARRVESEVEEDVREEETQRRRWDGVLAAPRGAGASTSSSIYPPTLGHQEIDLEDLD